MMSTIARVNSGQRMKQFIRSPRYTALNPRRKADGVANLDQFDIGEDLSTPR